MNTTPVLTFAIVALSVAATIQYFLGMKKIRWIASRMSRGAESALSPAETSYVNIGGAIGYNFEYRMEGLYASAKGTFTLLPRQSLLYLPFSLLMGVRDRFFINLFTKSRIRAEGHVVEARYLRRVKIDDLELMNRDEVERSGKKFVILWRGKDISKELVAILDACPNPRALRHFCSYPDTKTLFLHFNPKDGDVRPLLEAMVPGLRSFCA